MTRVLLRFANKALSPLSLRLVPERHELLHYQHDYGAEGYAAYRREQIAANKRKIDWVWADDRTLETIATDVERRGLKNGLCHGARNGFEVAWFARRLGGTMLGTDISDTAADFPGMVNHDFHDVRDDWIGRWDFVYTNSLDQAFDPARALDAWVGQLTRDGRIYIGHTMQHSPSGASEMDPFGAHPMAVPYLLFEWGRGKYRLDDILHVDGVSHKAKNHVWVFVIARA